ncbi:MAG: aminoacyl-tRNA hydrolase [Patescibacteria group bacterium]|jgi:PTH1 family peptidyl-tRNA hydrolase
MKPILIVGLGNPGEKYANSRHNFGFRILDALAKRWQLEKFKENRDKQGWELSRPGEPIVYLLKPLTFMNDSGKAVQNYATFYRIPLENTWVVHDDMDIPFGQMKIHRKLSAAGHNGIKSIIEHLNTQDFWRFRVGISRPQSLDLNEDGRVDSREIAIAKYGSADYVLEDFDAEQTKALSLIISKIAEAIEMAIKDGPEKAANLFNAKTA